jgi:monofunctional biosynthetic peptidoglycan transglycosylase
MAQRQLASALPGRQYAPVHYKWVDLELISPWMPLAVVAAEDQKFFQHQGFDFDAISEAIEKNKKRDRLQKVLPQRGVRPLREVRPLRGKRPLRKGRTLRGASTITQQVAKNLFLWPGRSYLRKGLEAYFTVLLESFLTKERILEVYVNIAEFGDGIYGVGAAAEHLFEKNPRKITRRESALLAAVLPSPKRFKARHPSAYVIRRVRWIERQMRQLGGPEYVTASDENSQGPSKNLLRDLTNAYFLLQ